MDPDERRFLIRHRPSGTYWMPDERGYTTEILCAGVYSQKEANRIVCVRPPDEEMIDLVEKLKEMKVNPLIAAAAAELSR